MTKTRKTLTSTLALLSLSIAMPQAAQAACLDDVVDLRAQLESGALTTLDLDAKAESSSTMAVGSTAGSANTDITGSINTDQQPATDGTNAKAESHAEGDVVVETSNGEVNVPVSDGKPRENWFGRPPADKTAEDYLAGAETAARDGDQAACREQLNDAKAALSAKVE